MLMPNLHAIAREILSESKFDQEKAVPALVARLDADKTLRSAILHEAATSVLRECASQQRARLHRTASAGVDDARGLALIAQEGYLDTYLLLNSVRLGDAKDEDLAMTIADYYSREKTMKARRQFLEAVRRSPKFKKGKRVRDCFTDLEIARLAGDFKC